MLVIDIKFEFGLRIFIMCTIYCWLYVNLYNVNRVSMV